MGGLLRSLSVPPSLSLHECGATGATATTLCGLPAAAWPVPFHNPPPHWVQEPLPCRESSLPRLPISAPPTSLDECFFCIFLVLGLSYSSIFCQSWLFFVFKLLLSFFWLCEEAQCVYLCLHLGWKSTLGIFHLFFHFSTKHSQFCEHFDYQGFKLSIK